MATAGKEKFIPWEPYRAAAQRLSNLALASNLTTDDGNAQVRFEQSKKWLYEVNPVVYRTSNALHGNKSGQDNCNSECRQVFGERESGCEKVPADPFLKSGSLVSSRDNGIDLTYSHELQKNNDTIRLEEMYSKLSKEHERALVEKEALLDQLDVVNKVNTELKRLLVATMGDDLQLKLECLSLDKVRLAQDLTHYSKKLSEDHENIEKLNIQCDVWKSKFLASSVMIDELTSWRIFLARQFENAQHAVKALLTELRSQQPPGAKSTESQLLADKICKIDSNHFYGSSPCDEFNQLFNGRACTTCHRTNCPGFHSPDYLLSKNATLNCCHGCHGEIQLV